MAEERQECCADWKPNTDKIDGFIMLQHARSGGRHVYDGKPFVYCPWCGIKRELATQDTQPRGEGK